MSKVTIKVDHVPDLLAALDRLAKKRVLIGIPGEKDARQGDKEVTNAMLGYVHEYGSPEQNIPARPFLNPAADQIRDKVITLLEKGADAVMSGNAEAGDKALAAAGMLGASKAKEIMQAGEGYEPLTEAAVRSRLYRAMGGLRKRDDPKAWAKRRKHLLSTRTRYTLEKAEPLIDTAQLRNAITYVVRDA